MCPSFYLWKRSIGKIVLAIFPEEECAYVCFELGYTWDGE